MKGDERLILLVRFYCYRSKIRPAKISCVSQTYLKKGESANTNGGTGFLNVLELALSPIYFSAGSGDSCNVSPTI